jgi:hypothetical protein
VSGATKPILSGSALRAKQVSITITPAKTILQLIIRLSMLNSRRRIVTLRRDPRQERTRLAKSFAGLRRVAGYSNLVLAETASSLALKRRRHKSSKKSCRARAGFLASDVYPV